jgi:hypothetical protein
MSFADAQVDRLRLELCQATEGTIDSEHSPTDVTLRQQVVLQRCACCG